MTFSVRAGVGTGKGGVGNALPFEPLVVVIEPHSLRDEASGDVGGRATRVGVGDISRSRAEFR
jgi:hypothetical protein